MTRHEFLNGAGLVQGGLLLVTLALAWVWGIDPWVNAQWEWRLLGEGFLATLPLLIIFAVTFRWPVGPLRQIKQFLLNSVGPAVAECHWLELLVVSLLAGLGEELLFRSVLQSELVWPSREAGWLFSSVLFALAHAVSALYAIFAGAISLYLGWLYDASSTFTTGPAPSLWRVVIVHTLYDFVVLLTLRVAVRSTPVDRVAAVSA